ncbi:hypothetical protein AVEN_199436-1 [Araneus ventricosus]|uniref:Uncharacterized protein n=1 Tax=Araneus ventricosus TaxID=182803 RepID=A0A4Y2M2Z3_ARAVE|nr:hypothetical protein AVEN_199436-1 [Araneus ventricosus]
MSHQWPTELNHSLSEEYDSDEEFQLPDGTASATAVINDDMMKATAPVTAANYRASDLRNTRDFYEIPVLQGGGNSVRVFVNRQRCDTWVSNGRMLLEEVGGPFLLRLTNIGPHGERPTGQINMLYQPYSFRHPGESERKNYEITFHRYFFYFF